MVQTAHDGQLDFGVRGKERDRIAVALAHLFAVGAWDNACALQNPLFYCLVEDPRTPGIIDIESNLSTMFFVQLISDHISKAGT